MKTSGTPYDAQYSETFNAKKNDPKFQGQDERIKDKCNLIRSAPYTACRSERLKWKWSGKRSGHLDKRFRIIYMICEECIRLGDKKRNNCADCEGIALRRVRFIDITDYH